MRRTVLTTYSTPTAGTVTLSASAANYQYIEIFYTDNNNRQAQSVRVYSPNGKTIDLSCIEATDTTNRAYLRTSRYEISDKKITFKQSKYVTLESGQNPIVTHSTTTNHIKIQKVIGYSE
jgi:hypothetical protein